MSEAQLPTQGDDAASGTHTPGTQASAAEPAVAAELAGLAQASAQQLAAVAQGYTARPMTAQDLVGVHELELTLFPEDAWPLHMFQDELAHPEWRRYWLIEDGAGLVGYAGAQYSPHLADVQTIGVAPGHEGKGLGTFLLLLMAERAKAWGATDLMLEVRSDNPRAQQLYLRHGFETIHTRKRYYQDGTDALIMRLSLAGFASPSTQNPQSTTQGESA